MTTEESNVFIDQFHNGREPMTNGTHVGKKRGSEGYENYYDTELISELKYHSSWDWIMPVVEKFKKYLNNMERPSKNHCCEGDFLEVDVQCAIYEVNIIKTYDALIPCIQWHNNYIKSKKLPNPCNQK